MKKRQVLFVSDRTGLTAESYGKSLLSQFPDVEFESHLYPFVDTKDRAKEVAKEIVEKSRDSFQKAVQNVEEKADKAKKKVEKVIKKGKPAAKKVEDSLS